jgi:hypothetical protein
MKASTYYVLALGLAGLYYMAKLSPSSSGSTSSAAALDQGGSSQNSAAGSTPVDPTSLDLDPTFGDL